MVTKEMIEKLMDSDINNFIDMARRYHLDHIALEKFTNPEYFVEFNSDFILSHWDKISDFMRFNNVR